MAKGSGSWGRPAVPALALGAIITGLATASGASQARAQALPVAGFAPADTAAILESWPFDGPAFSASSLGGGDGVAEAALEGIMAAIRSDPRFVPEERPGTIAEGAIPRPPPDSILWPSVAGEGAVPEYPSPAGDLAPWNLVSRQETGRHQANARVLEVVAPQRLEQAGAGLSFVSPSARPAMAADSMVLAANAARPLVAVMESLAAGCGGAPGCAAITRAKEWAGAGTADPIQAMVGRALLDAASAGAFADTPSLRMAAMTGRADQRRRLGVTPQAAAGDPVRYRIEAVERLPWEVATVLGAAVLEMRKLEAAGPTWPVTIDDAAARALKEPVFRYQGFDLFSIAVTRYSRALSGAFDLSVILTFLDGGGRRATVSAALSYFITGEGIQVVAAELALLAAPGNHARVVIAPAGIAPEFGPGVDPVPLLIQAVENEVTPRTADPIPQSFDIFAFFLDRMPPDAEVQIRLGGQSIGVAGYAAGGAMDFDGWRVARLRGAFALNGPTEFFIKAIYRPGGPVPGFDRDGQVLEIVSSHGRPQAAAQSVPPAPAQARTFPNLAAAP